MSERPESAPDRRAVGRDPLAGLEDLSSMLRRRPSRGRGSVPGTIPLAESPPAPVPETDAPAPAPGPDAAVAPGPRTPASRLTPLDRGTRPLFEMLDEEEPFSGGEQRPAGLARTPASNGEATSYAPLQESPSDAAPDPLIREFWQEYANNAVRPTSSAQAATPGAQPAREPDADARHTVLTAIVPQPGERGGRGADDRDAHGTDEQEGAAAPALRSARSPRAAAVELGAAAVMPARSAAAAAPHPETAEVDRLYEAAKDRAAAGDHARAIETYQEVLARDPFHVRARNNLGLAYDCRGQFELAINEYVQALALDPRNVQVLCNLGAAYGSRGWYDKAEDVLKQALRLDPKSAQAHCNLGIVYCKKGLYQLAVIELKRAVELDEEFVQAFYYLGECYNHLDQVDDAIDAFERALQGQPQNAKAFYNLGILFDKKSMPERAMLMYRRARQLQREA